MAMRPQSAVECAQFPKGWSCMAFTSKNNAGPFHFTGRGRINSHEQPACFRVVKAICLYIACLMLTIVVPGSNNGTKQYTTGMFV